MYKRIDPSDVVLGMYIQKLTGNWFSHPFWRARFLLTDPAKLAQLQASDVPGVIIDTERGIDPDAAVAEPPNRKSVPKTRLRQMSMARPLPLPPPASPASSMIVRQPRVLSAQPATVARGFGRAQNVADRGLKAVSRVFLEMRLGKAISLSTVGPVVNSIMTSMQDNPHALNGLLRFRRDNEDVYRHALATCALMIALGRSLRLESMDLHAAGLAGLLLDSCVGLLTTDGQTNAGQLPPGLWERHVSMGHDFIVKSRLSDPIARACLEHHERFDGGGWPNAIGGKSLSLLGRMAAICDAYDLLASDAPGAPGLDPGEALSQMKSDHGAFDPELLSALETTIGVWPIGSVVALQSGRLGVVIDQNRDAPDKPLIAVFFDIANRQRVHDLWIDLGACYGADAISGAGAINTLPHGIKACAAAALSAAIDQTMPTAKSAARATKAA